MLLLHIDLTVKRVLFKPGLSLSKAGMRASGPLHRRAGIVPAEKGECLQRFLLRNTCPDRHAVGIDGGNIVQLPDRHDLFVLHADLLPLIYKGKAAAEKIDRCQRFFGRFAPDLVRKVAACASGLIVVLYDRGIKAYIPDLPVRPENALLVRLDIYALRVEPPFVTVPVDLCRKIEHRGEIAVLADEQRQVVLFLVEDLSHGESVIGRKRLVPHLAKEFPDSLRFHQHIVDTGETVVPVGGIIAEHGWLFDIDDGVDAESADPFFHPPPDILIHFLPELRVFPVQVRLLFVKYMQIQLVRAGQFVPAGSAKIGPPVGRKPALRVLVPQIKEFAVLSVRILAGLSKPLVFIGAVVDDEIHQDRHPSLPCLRDQLLHVLHGAESGIDRVIVGYIITFIRQRRLIDRRQPDDIDAQILQIIQFADNALQISDSVAAHVHKALGVNLIGDFVMPPFSFHK